MGLDAHFQALFEMDTTTIISRLQLSANDEESDESDSDVECSVGSVTFGSRPPTFVDAGKLLYEEGVRQRSQVAIVAQNVEKAMKSLGLTKLRVLNRSAHGWH